jgi:hypothetical protein
MSVTHQETHKDSELSNEALIVQLIESLVVRFKDRYKTERERHEVLETLRATLNL